LPPAKTNVFRCLAQLDGALLDVAISRVRPEPGKQEPLAIAP
jgi:hypothetical protein